ncbi:MAG TPA: glycerol kinase [Acidimicrobiales bacterium]|nr:glycerol kinase [Acidimicrobiales bacterium]
MAVVMAIDAGTTGVRALAVGPDSPPRASSYREFPQHFPRPGWVEHDPDDIWDAVLATTTEVLEGVDEAVAAVGVTVQRETVVAWDRRDGRPRHRAIVWQDRRTASRCDELREAGHLPALRARTGLVLDPYFSATKLEWLLTEGGVEADADLAVGTVDSWIVWNLTGGAVHATDPSNASRTLLFDIGERRWSGELCDLFGVPGAALPEVRPSSGRVGVTAAGATPFGAGVPVSGIAGDQQAALFGQACFEPGMVKATHGTGSFVLVNAGPDRPPPPEGLLTTVAWTLADGTTAYAVEGSVFATGAAIGWLRDGLGLLEDVAEVGPLAESLPGTEGVYLVPAFAGLGSPWWDPWARGAVVGLTRGTGRGHLARAAVEAIAHQTRDVVDAMVAATGRQPTVVRVDGGASVMDLLLQLQADQLGVTVARPAVTETTALGAAWLAGLGEGVWSSLEELAASWRAEREVEPQAPRSVADARHRDWRRAVDRARSWARPGD